MDEAVMKMEMVDISPLKEGETMRVTMHVPGEFTGQLTATYGQPTPKYPVWVAVARLQNEEK